MFIIFSWLYSQLPDNKQMLAVSATYPEVLAQHLTVYMRNPTFIRLNAQDPSLLGDEINFFRIFTPSFLKPLVLNVCLYHELIYKI